MQIVLYGSNVKAIRSPYSDIVWTVSCQYPYGDVGRRVVVGAHASTAAGTIVRTVDAVAIHAVSHHLYIPPISESPRSAGI